MYEDVHWYGMGASMFWVGTETNTFWSGTQNSTFWRRDMLYFASNTTAGSDGLMHTFHTEMKGGSSHNSHERDIVALQVTSSQGFQSPSCTQQEHLSPYFFQLPDKAPASSLAHNRATELHKKGRGYGTAHVVSSFSK